MDFLELAMARFSCRGFSDKKVENEKIEKILEAAKLAPTACNFQPQKILVLTEEDQLKKIKNCTQYGWNAPVMMIIFYDKEISYKRNRYDGKEFGDIDSSIVTTHMMLETQNLGLGTTWIGSFDSQKVMENFKVPSNYVPVAILPIGYPSKEIEPSQSHFERKNIDDFTFWNQWEAKDIQD